MFASKELNHRSPLLGDSGATSDTTTLVTAAASDQLAKPDASDIKILLVPGEPPVTFI